MGAQPLPTPETLEEPSRQRTVERASRGVDAYRLALTDQSCFVPSCGLPASMLVAPAGSGASRGYCREHGERAATLLAGREVITWPVCAVDACEQLATVLGLARLSATRTEVLLVCRDHRSTNDQA